MEKSGAEGSKGGCESQTDYRIPFRKDRVFYQSYSKNYPQIKKIGQMDRGDRRERFGGYGGLAQLDTKVQFLPFS